MQRLFLMLIFFLAAMAAYGQNILTDTLTWSSTSTVDQENNAEIIYNCSFKSTPASIDWIQKDGAKVYRYTVTSVDGSWPSLDQDGQLTFQVSAAGNVTGSCTFSRVEEQLTVHLKVSTNGIPDLDLIFNIAIVQPAQ